MKEKKKIRNTKYSLLEFIEKARKVHGDKYDYSKVNYINVHTKICIICRKKDTFGEEHGEFWQLPYVHLQGNGCPKCGGVCRMNTSSFIKRAKQIHGKKYDYSKVTYANNKTKVCIICPTHGEFLITPHMHLEGQGCRKCSDEKNSLKRRKSIKQFIEEARKIHGNKYDYSKAIYKTTEDKIQIICPIHGGFLQTPHMHLSGNGCPKCKQSHIERIIEQLLSSNDVAFKYNTKPHFLSGLEADFYLEKEKIIIECQGSQHLLEDHFFEPFKFILERDLRKYKLSQEHKVPIIYVLSKNFAHQSLKEQFNHMYDDAIFIEDIEENPQILLNKISETKIN